MLSMSGIATGILCYIWLIPSAFFVTILSILIFILSLVALNFLTKKEKPKTEVKPKIEEKTKPINNI